MESLSRYFDLKRHNTDIKTEVVAGLTTFLAMAYITVVNPAILSDAGMDFGAVFVATCIAAAFGSIAMGILGNYPIAMAPGMGQNAFFCLRYRAGVRPYVADRTRCCVSFRYHFYCHECFANSRMAYQRHT